MKQIYVAGPMTGHEAYNYAKFMRVADRAREHFRCQVYTPFNANNLVWMKWHHRQFDPFRDVCEYGSRELKEMFLLDLEYTCTSDAVVLLDGWERSRGARIEVQVAKLLGIALFSEDFSPINPQISVDIVP